MTRWKPTMCRRLTLRPAAWRELKVYLIKVRYHAPGPRGAILPSQSPLPPHNCLLSSGDRKFNEISSRLSPDYNIVPLGSCFTVCACNHRKSSVHHTFMNRKGKHVIAFKILVVVFVLLRCSNTLSGNNVLVYCSLIIWKTAIILPFFT